MHTRTLTFLRIFSVRRFRYKSSQSTDFGFEADGRTHYEARVQGWPEFEAGDTVTVLMKSPDRWTTMLGWVHHGTGELTYWMPPRSFAWLLAVTMLLVGVPSGYLGFVASDGLPDSVSRMPFRIIAVFFLLLLVSAVCGMVRARTVRRKLESLRAALGIKFAP